MLSEFEVFFHLIHVRVRHDGECVVVTGSHQALEDEVFGELEHDSLSFVFLWHVIAFDDAEVFDVLFEVVISDFENDSGFRLDGRRSDEVVLVRQFVSSVSVGMLRKEDEAPVIIRYIL